MLVIITFVIVENACHCRKHSHCEFIYNVENCDLE